MAGKRRNAPWEPSCECTLRMTCECTLRMTCECTLGMMSPTAGRVFLPQIVTVTVWARLRRWHASPCEARLALG